jgi:hypothetical protein
MRAHVDSRRCLAVPAVSKTRGSSSVGQTNRTVRAIRLDHRVYLSVPRRPWVRRLRRAGPADAEMVCLSPRPNGRRCGHEKDDRILAGRVAPRGLRRLCGPGAARAWCLRGSAASGGHRAAALVGMGLGLARPVALMVGQEESPGVLWTRRGLRPRDDRPSVDSKTMVGHGVAGS